MADSYTKDGADAMVSENSQVEIDGKVLFVSAEPLETVLANCKEVRIVQCRSLPERVFWSSLLKTHHPLGCGKGYRVCQLVVVGRRIVGAVGWKNAVRQMRIRDDFLGWGREQRDRELIHVANQARFLILPRIRVPHLASQAISRSLKDLRTSWPDATNADVWLTETFVDRATYRGTCYQASNWLRLGETRGFARVTNRRFAYHGQKKHLYVFPMVRNIHKQLGTELCFRPSEAQLSCEQIQELVKMVQKVKISESVLARLKFASQEEFANELHDYAQSYMPCFAKSNTLLVMVTYWTGLLSTVRRKNIEAMAMEVNGGSVRQLQEFINSYSWEEWRMMRILRESVSETLAVEDACIALDPSDMPKKGTESVGVARQYCGQLGKVDSCQSGVFATYISEKGYALVGKRLFLPEVWLSDDYKERREKTGIPLALQRHKTKIELGLEIVDEIIAEGVLPFRWVLGDNLYGKSQDFRKQISDRGLLYFLDASANTKVNLPEPYAKSVTKGQVRLEPKSVTIEQIKEREDLPWELVELGPGQKGPITAKMAIIRVELQGQWCWLVIRVNMDGSWKAGISNAPEETTKETLFKISLQRWKIEQCFRESKQLLGMGDYETRSWDGWHRHMALVFTIYFFLTNHVSRIDPKGKCVTKYMITELIRAALSGSKVNFQKALYKITYHIKRNIDSLVSHWQATLKKINAWGKDLNLTPKIKHKSPESYVL